MGEAAASHEVNGAEVHLSGVVHLYSSSEGEVVALSWDRPSTSRRGSCSRCWDHPGAGKSTVLGLLAGEFPPSAGTVRIGEHDFGSLGPDALSRLRSEDISLVVQGAARNLLPYATAKENVWFAQHGARVGADADPRAMRASCWRSFGASDWPIAGCRTCRWASVSASPSWRAWR